nr:venom protein [Lampona murina]
MKYMLFIVMCFAFHVYADDDEDVEMKLIREFMKALEEETGKRAMLFIEERDGKRILKVVLCDDENDCKEKQENNRVEDIFIRLA